MPLTRYDPPSSSSNSASTARRRERCEYAKRESSLSAPENGRDAVARIEKERSKYEHDYENANGDHVFFEFVGIRDLIDLAILEEDEVWYDIRTMLSPMERKDRLIPEVEELLARL